MNSLAIIDSREWQKVFDLRTGKEADNDGRCVRMAKGVLSRHPFPGDTDDKSNTWVTDVALDFIREYDPSFIWITYAQQFYNRRFTPMTDSERKAMDDAAFAEVERFIEASDFIPVIVGTGDMGPVKGLIDVTSLDGLAITTHWTTRYAGFHDASTSDLHRLKKIPHIERIVPREEFIALFSGNSAEAARVPELILVAEEGYAFKTIGGAHRPLVRIPASPFRIPVSRHAGSAEEITAVRKMVDSSLKKGKTALIVMEGIGFREFPWPCTECLNGREWYFYEVGSDQMLTLSTGEHRVFDHPTGYRYFDEATGNKEYPLSGFFMSIPENTVGRGFPGRSVAVGNRSMFMHMIPGTDISLECFARNLYNQGTMAVIHRQDKW